MGIMDKIGRTVMQGLAGNLNEMTPEARLQ